MGDTDVPNAVVFDASVWVSSLMYPTRAPDRALDAARDLVVRSLVSEPLLDQVRRALQGPRFGRTAADVRFAVDQMRTLSEIVAPTFVLTTITAKESDNRVLECAVAGRADVIVTGDRKHLLPLGAFRGIPIRSPADFLTTLGH